MEDLDLF